MVRWFAMAATTGACAWLAAAATANAQPCAAPGTATTACTGTNCATLTAPTRTGAKGGTVELPIMFEQGPDDSQAGQGFDEVSAIAFTLGAASGDSAPLTFDCTDGNLADGSVTGTPTDFTVVVENARCTNRNRCLCPDTGAGQTRDNFVNLVVYGPRNLPEQGPVEIPVLPDSGNIATLKMRIASDAPDEIPLHIYSTLDAAAKPQFAANLSIGDQAACDVTAAGTQSNVKFVDGKVTVGGVEACVGDCGADGAVGIAELVRGVNIALGFQPVSACEAFDCQNNDTVPISCLIQGVNNSLNGCP